MGRKGDGTKHRVSPHSKPTSKRASSPAPERAGAGVAAAGENKALAVPVGTDGQGRDAAQGTGVAAAEEASSNLNATFQNLTIGRHRQRRLALTLAKGSISNVDSRAYVLGVFRGVAPSGAARGLDKHLEGAITEFTARRMFSGDLGAVFTIPIGRNQLPADMVLFVGLGTFDQFTPEVQQLAAENAIRVLVRSRVDEFATVLIGLGTGQTMETVLKGLLTGFLRGLKDADPRQRFRSITFCETDPQRYSDMKNELYRLASTSLFDDVEMTLDEVEVPPAPQPTVRVLAPVQEPVYTIIRQESEFEGNLKYLVSILGTGMKAAVRSDEQIVNAKAMETLLNQFDKKLKDGATSKDIQKFGSAFAKQFIPKGICTDLESMKDRHIVVVHDALSSRIPWETLTINGWTPVVEAGLSRRYLAGNLPIATWLEERRLAPSLKLLLIVNPLEDLDGAEEEGRRIQELAGATAQIEATPLWHSSASKGAILEALRSGKYDIVHYAGHAFFDPDRPGQSGLVCAGDQVLRGVDLTGLTNLPAVVFFNACEAGRLRDGKGISEKKEHARKAKPLKPASTQIGESAGVAEALMRGGIANYISTYWPVKDSAAKAFSAAFYQGLMGGKSLGSSLLDGRQAILSQSQNERDWADYILYGNFDFVLKQPSKPS